MFKCGLGYNKTLVKLRKSICRVRKRPVAKLLKPSNNNCACERIEGKSN
jgi:hypothetical protein